MKRPGGWLAAAASSAMLVACATPVTMVADLSGDDRDKWPISTAPVILVGDTQEHEIMGLPASLKGGFFDRQVEVTIRPPQQALFGRMVLADLIQNAGDRPIIHLGDLLDLSCRSELARMDKVLALAGENWVLAPGNHDGLAMGILNFSSDTEKIGYGSWAWDYECRVPSADGTITRTDGPQGYLASSDVILHWYLNKKRILSDQDAAIKVPGKIAPFDPRSLAKKQGRVLSDAEVEQERCAALPGVRVHWTQPESPGPHVNIEAVEARIEHWSRCYGTLPTRSFLLQKVALPMEQAARAFKVSMILLDTTQTDRRFDGIGLGLFGDTGLADFVSTNPGEVGYLMDDQLQALREMIRKQGENEILIFGGHHPWEKLSPGSRKKLAEVLKETRNPLVYISAHTHTGYWKDHQLGDRPLLELNVSSLADWPVAFRELRVQVSRDRKSLRIAATLNHLDEGKHAKEQADSTSALLVDDWKEYCDSFDFDRLRRKHTEIVEAHRLARQDWTLFIDATLTDWIRSATIDKWDNYVDKLNDMEKGAEALGLAADLDPGSSFRSRIAPKIAEIEKAAKLDKPCDKNALRKCMSDSWQAIRKRMEVEDVVDSYYDKFSNFIAQAQQVVDDTKEKEERTYLACSAVAAAMGDAAIQTNRGADILAVDPTYYIGARTVAW